MRHRKIIFVTGFLAGIIILLTQCIGKNASTGDSRGDMYAGASTCSSCHKEIVNSHIHSNHYKTSGRASSATLKKNTSSSNNTVHYMNNGFVRVEEKQSQFFQSYILEGKEQRSEKAEIAIGSAEKAQTYGYWKDGQLRQLPLTYISALQSWTNSPGYPMDQPYFERPILSRCLECHASYASKTDIESGPLQLSEKIDPGSIIFGIDCERCHGPAAEHVQFHRDNPTEKQAKFIVSIKSLSRQQQLDLCASCHSGNDLDVQRTMFAFRPGDTLKNFYFPYFGTGGKEPDVHGKQMQLLQTSKCFQQSTMTCKSCHDLHQAEESQITVFISKCMVCHQNSAHSVEMKTGNKNCINCHMPLQVSKSLIFNNGTENKTIPYLLRTHRIAIYPEAEWSGVESKK